jgi:hypothetical protein
MKKYLKARELDGKIRDGALKVAGLGCLAASGGFLAAGCFGLASLANAGASHLRAQEQAAVHNTLLAGLPANREQGVYQQAVHRDQEAKAAASERNIELFIKRVGETDCLFIYGVSDSEASDRSSEVN